MQKIFFTSKYYNLALVKAFMIGGGYDDQEILLIIGPLAITIHIWAFRPRTKSQGVEL